MRRHSSPDPLPPSTEVRACGYDEAVGVYLRDSTPLEHVDRRGRRLGLPVSTGTSEGYGQPIGLFFARKHSEHGWRDEIHLTFEEASWVAGELLRHCRTHMPAVVDVDVAAKQLHLLDEDLAGIRTRILELARGLGRRTA